MVACVLLITPVMPVGDRAVDFLLKTIALMEEILQGRQVAMCTFGARSTHLDEFVLESVKTLKVVVTIPVGG